VCSTWPWIHFIASPTWRDATIVKQQLVDTGSIIFSSATTQGTPSLYCFALTLPFGNEPKLLWTQFKKHESLFACDECTVFSNVTFSIDPKVVTTPIGGSMAVNFGGKWGTALNTDIFIRVWRAVFSLGLYQYYEWTVKVDPDAVFLPQRLRKVLLPMATMGPMYINNCEWGMHGPLEVISHEAMAIFLANMDSCEGIREAAMQWQPVHWKPLIHRYGGDDKDHTFGEDQYLRRCLHLLNILKVDNFDLLSEPACAFRKANCASSTSVAMHPFKTPESYVACYEYAKALTFA